jgi:hypothetical protein
MRRQPGQPIEDGPDVGRDEVGRHQVGEPLEPERAELGEHGTLVGDGLAHDDVERAHAVARDQQQMFGVQLVDLADLALPQ